MSRAQRQTNAIRYNTRPIRQQLVNNHPSNKMIKVLTIPAK